MKISYVTTYNAADVHNWSGLGYNIAESLKKQNAELHYIGVLKNHLDLKVRFKQLFLKGLGRMTLGDRMPFVAKNYSQKAEKMLRPDTDVIFSPGSLPIAMMDNPYPKVIYTDATFAGMVNYYPDFSNFSKRAIRIGNTLEQRALDNCVLAIYSSEWAAETALRSYKVNPAKVKTVPFGANLPATHTLSNLKQIIDNRSRTTCKLLFLGVDWDRKGGPKAFQIAELLNKNGIRTELHIAGVKGIPSSEMPSFVIDHGFQSKATPEGISKLTQLISECHFLLLPTNADCSPVVFCEASSLGVPSITTNVGGNSTIVHNDINGQTFSLSADATAYVMYIKEKFCDVMAYRELCYSSFREYESRLNWDITGKKIMSLLETIMPAPKPKYSFWAGN